MRKLCCLAALLTRLCAAELPAGVTVDSNLAYGEYKQTVMDVFQPKPSVAAGKRPGVIVFHDGDWGTGSKEEAVSAFVVPYLEQGFVVADVDVRLTDTAPAPAAVLDAITAANWFRSNAHRWNVDSRRIVATGGSAGGHLALMAGMAPKSARLGPPNRLAAVINFYGITDVEDNLQGGNLRDFAVKWIDGQKKERYDLARRVSPIAYVRKKKMPAILTIHGNADEVVPYDQAIELTKALRDVHADAEMINVPNGGHGFPPETLNKLYPQVFEFLRRRGILR